MYGLYTVFSIWELMEQYSTCQTMLISTSIFIGSIGLRELMEGSYGGWHNWFCAHLAERYSCMPPIIYSFIQQTCQILGIKRKLRFSSDRSTVCCGPRHCQGGQGVILTVKPSLRPSGWGSWKWKAGKRSPYKVIFAIFVSSVELTALSMLRASANSVRDWLKLLPSLISFPRISLSTSSSLKGKKVAGSHQSHTSVIYWGWRNWVLVVKRG